MSSRLTTAESAFLELESAGAPMHIGWVATLRPDPARPRPTLRGLRERVARRLDCDQRLRQRPVPCPLGLHRPVWQDDPRFDLARHVRQLAERERTAADFCRDAEELFAQPLTRERPLWEIVLAPRLAEGRIGIIGRIHQSMVDDLGSLQLAKLLFDPLDGAEPPEAPRWEPRAPRPAARLALDGASELLFEQISALGGAARAAADPRLVLRATGEVRRGLRSAVHYASRPAPASYLNQPITLQRHLATCSLELETIQGLGRPTGATINEVVLAIVGGALRQLAITRGERRQPLRMMIPVNVRPSDASTLVTQIAFAFINLPIHLQSPAGRLRAIQAETKALKSSAWMPGSQRLLRAISHFPPSLTRSAASLIASPRLFNLVVSHIPGPPTPVHVLGARLDQVHPVVPIPTGHALSIGAISHHEHIHLGCNANLGTLPEADQLPELLRQATSELQQTTA